MRILRLLGAGTPSSSIPGLGSGSRAPCVPLRCLGTAGKRVYCGTSPWDPAGRLPRRQDPPEPAELCGHCPHTLRPPPGPHGWRPLGCAPDALCRHTPGKSTRQRDTRSHSHAAPVASATGVVLGVTATVCPGVPHSSPRKDGRRHSAPSRGTLPDHLTEAPPLRPARHLAFISLVKPTATAATEESRFVSSWFASPTPAWKV